MKALKTLFAAGCLLAAGTSLAAENSLRFGTEALYPPFESNPPAANWKGSTSNWATRCAPPRS